MASAIRTKAEHPFPIRRGQTEVPKPSLPLTSLQRLAAGARQKHSNGEVQVVNPSCLTRGTVKEIGRFLIEADLTDDTEWARVARGWVREGRVPRFHQ